MLKHKGTENIHGQLRQQALRLTKSSGAKTTKIKKVSQY